MFSEKKKGSFIKLGIIQEPFEFMSPLTLEECVKRLRDKSEPTRLFSFKNPLKVEVTQLDPDGYQFKLQRDAGRNLNVEVVGTLARTDEGTYVSGRGQLSRATFVLALLLMVVQFPIFVQILGPGILVLDGLMLAIFWSVMASTRHSLVWILINTLGQMDGYILPTNQPHRQHK